MIDFMEIHEAARYSNHQIKNSIKAGEKAYSYLSSAIRQLTKKNISATEILAILRTLHDANDQILISNSQCKEASEELERKIVCE